MTKFRVVATASFERQLKKIFRVDADAEKPFVVALTLLMYDPFGHGYLSGIKKLKGVKRGEGRWRVRVGRYRLRYDIDGHAVVLHSMRDRKDVYK